MNVAGHLLLPNGDLLVAYHRPRHGLILVMVWRIKDGLKALVDSWCEPRCPGCGRSEWRGHARACKRRAA